MNKKIILIVVLLILSLLLTHSLTTRPRGGRYTQEEHLLFFPLVMHSTPFLGAQIEGDFSVKERQLDDDLVPGAVYQYPVRWRDSESESGSIQLPSYVLENSLILSDYKTIVGIKTTPAWAALWPEHPGSPPRPGRYRAFARFANYVIETTGAWAVELYNEPDISCTHVDTTTQRYYGCWIGLNEDEYTGGLRYGEFLRVVYPLIKAGHPDVIVIGGALMRAEGRFVDGMLAASPKMDYLSFHKYIGIGDDFDSTMIALDRLHSLFGVEVIVSETAVIDNLDSQQLRNEQALYMQHLADNPHPGAKGMLWYNFGNHGWQNSDMIYDNERKPVYYIFRSILQ